MRSVNIPLYIIIGFFVGQITGLIFSGYYMNLQVRKLIDDTNFNRIQKMIQNAEKTCGTKTESLKIEKDSITIGCGV